MYNVSFVTHIHKPAFLTLTIAKLAVGEVPSTSQRSPHTGEEKIQKHPNNSPVLLKLVLSRLSKRLGKDEPT